MIEIGSENGPAETVTAETTQVYVIPGSRDPILIDGCEEMEVWFVSASVLFPSVSATM